MCDTPIIGEDKNKLPEVSLVDANGQTIISKDKNKAPEVCLVDSDGQTNISKDKTGIGMDPGVPRMEPKDLYQLAEDIDQRKVFTDRHMESAPGRCSLPNVFMPLIFARDWVKKYHQDIGMIYEYMDKAGQTAINGMPIFQSMRIVHKDDVDELVRYITELRDAREAIKKKVVEAAQASEPDKANLDNTEV